MQPSADPSVEMSPPTRSRWPIIGGILGLVGAVVWVAATLHYSSVAGGFWNWAFLLALPLVAALSAVVLLAARKPWTLLGAGGLLAAGLYATIDNLSVLMVRHQASTGQSLAGLADFMKNLDRVAQLHLAAAVVVLVGGVVGLLGRHRVVTIVRMVSFHGEGDS